MFIAVERWTTLKVSGSQPARDASSFVLLLGIFCLLGCSTAPPVTLARFEFTQTQMGLPFRMVLYAPDQAAANSASAAAFARIKQLNDILSDYETDSELSQLSRTSGQGRAVKVSADLWFVLKRARA